MKTKIFFLMFLIAFNISAQVKSKDKNEGKSYITEQQYFMDRNVDKIEISTKFDLLKKDYENLRDILDIIEYIIGSIVLVLLAIVITLIFSLMKEKSRFLTRKDFEKAQKEFDKKCTDKLTQIIDKLSNLDGMQIDHLLKGNSELEKGNYELAELNFRLEISRKEQPNAWSGLARAYRGLNESEKALKAVDRAIALDKNDLKFNAWGQLSLIKVKILMDMEKYKEADDALVDEVLKMDPGSKKAMDLLELCRNKSKNKKKK